MSTAYVRSMFLGFRYLSVSEKPLCLTRSFLRTARAWRSGGCAAWFCCRHRCLGALVLTAVEDAVPAFPPAGSILRNVLTVNMPLEKFALIALGNGMTSGVVGVDNKLR